MPARVLIEAYFDPVSYHITGDHPTREVPPGDRELHQRIFQVGFQRGFEPLLVNVYSDTATEQDAEEAAVEFLGKVPGVLTPEEVENQAASFVKRLAEGRELREFAAGTLPPTRDELDQFTRAYIEAALEMLSDEDKERFEDGVSLEDIAPATLKQMVADCRKFQAENAEAISVGCTRGGGQWSDDQLAGTDFYLTRCEHGAGFQDGDWPEPQAKQLTDAAHAFGNVDFYVGDDNLIYQAGAEGDWQLRSFTPKNAKGGLIGSVKVTDTEAPPDPVAPTFAANGEDEDDEDMEESVEQLVTRLLAEDEQEGGPEVEDVICPACDAMQPDAQARLGGLGNRVHYRCRYCGGDWSASKMGPAEGDSPGDY